jgi:hypothetical protein
VVAGQTFTLTTSDAGASTGTSSNDRFIALDDALTNYVVDGGEGSDSLKATISATDSYDVTSVEALDIKVTAVATIDMSDFTGEETLRLSGTGNTTLNNYSAGVALTSAMSGTATIDLELDDDSGTADSITVALDNATSTGVTTIDGIESITVTGSSDNDTIDLTSTGLRTLTVTTAKEMNVDLISTTVTTIDGTGSTGDLDLNVPANDLAITLGSGGDVLSIAGLDADDDIDLGDGVDTIALTAAGDAFLTSAEAGDIAVTGAEVLRLIATDGAAADAIDFDAFAEPDQFGTVAVLTALDAMGVTLTDIQATTVAAVNGAYGAAGDNTNNAIALLVYDKKTSTAEDDSVTFSFTSSSVDAGDATTDFVVTQLTANFIENFTFSLGHGAGDDEDASITTFTANAAESLTILGDVDFTLTAPATVTSVSAGSMTGDLDITFSAEDVSVTGGAGDDTFTFGASLNADDSVVGGAGDDTLEATFGAAVYDDDIEADVETLAITQAAGANAVTLDLRDVEALELITMAADATQGTTTTFDNAGTAFARLTLTAAGHAGDVYAVALDDDSDADTLRVDLDASVIGTVTVNDHESVRIDFDSATSNTLADLNGSDIETLTLTDDVYDGTIVNAIDAALDGALTMVINTAAYGASLGYADAAAATAADYIDETGADALHGIVAEASSRYSIVLADIRVDADHRTVINLTDTAGKDTISWVNSVLDSTNDIGLVTIVNFGDVAAVGAASATVLDLSAFGIEGLADLVFADKDIDGDATSDADDILLITAADTDDFAGTIELVGVSVADVNSDNFIFAG